MRLSEVQAMNPFYAHVEAAFEACYTYEVNMMGPENEQKEEGMD